MKTPLVIALVAGALSLAGCANDAAEEPSAETVSAAEAVLDSYGLAGLDATEVIETLDQLPVAERSADLTASVRPTELLVGDASVEEPIPLDLPPGQFYLSVAPYVDATHDCYFHSLTTCQGELAVQEVRLTVVDDATGEVLVDEVTTTYGNGFVATWLPSGIDATLTVTYGDLSGEREISTGDEDPTCITDLQLT